MSGAGSRIGLWLALAGCLLIGGAAGALVAPGAAVEGLPKEDGDAVFGVVGEGGKLLSGWAEVRASSGRRSLSLLQGGAQRPQVLVFPREGNWPALSVPGGWEVAWLDGEGKVLEFRPASGEPMVPKVGNAWAVLTLPKDHECISGLSVGRRVFWGRSKGGGA